MYHKINTYYPEHSCSLSLNQVKVPVLSIAEESVSGLDAGNSRSERLPSEVTGLNDGGLISELHVLSESVSELDKPELRLLVDSNANPGSPPEAFYSSP